MGLNPLLTWSWDDRFENLEPLFAPSVPLASAGSGIHTRRIHIPQECTIIQEHDSAWNDQPVGQVKAFIGELLHRQTRTSERVVGSVDVKDVLKS
jgi:hypothetical protein